MSKTQIILMSVFGVLLTLAAIGFLALNQQANADYNAASTAIMSRQIDAIATLRASTPSP